MDKINSKKCNTRNIQQSDKKITWKQEESCEATCFEKKVNQNGECKNFCVKEANKFDRRGENIGRALSSRLQILDNIEKDLMWRPRSWMSSEENGWQHFQGYPWYKNFRHVF